MKNGQSNLDLAKLLCGDWDFDVSAVSSVTASRTPEQGLSLLLTVEQAGHALQIGRSHLYNLMASRKIKSIKVGGSRRIPMLEIESYIGREMDDGEEI